MRCERVLLSIIVPMYNCISGGVQRCLDSILAQTMRDFELILVDDGSTNGSAKIFDDYASQDARIRVIHQRNQGVSAARNTGVAAASGDYIAFVDADDWIEPTMYERLLTAAREYDVDIVKCGVTITDGHSTEQSYKYQNGEQVFRENVSQIYFELWEARVVWNGIYRADVARAVTFPVGITAGEDDYASLAFLLAADSVAFIPDFLYNYYQNPAGSASYTDGNYMRALAADKMVELLEHTTRAYPATVREQTLASRARKYYHLVREGRALDLPMAKRKEIMSALDLRRKILFCLYSLWYGRMAK